MPRLTTMLGRLGLLFHRLRAGNCPVGSSLELPGMLFSPRTRR